MEFNSQICTTREQSERLIALGLKKETADLWWVELENGSYALCIVGQYFPKDAIPAWSLHGLIEIVAHTQYPQSYECPEGYVFKDENGNVINATKIVLERKKEVILTQEQIDTMVQESCVLFCKHCGCGVPRETCTSLGTCKEHDDYRKSIRTHFEKHKK